MKRRRPRPSAILVRRLATVCALTAGAGALPPLVGPNTTLFAQREIRPPKEQRQPFYGPPPPPSPAERIGKDLVRIGTITVDTARKEFSVGGFINDVQVLEFLANTKGGWKAYESAIELDTNAVNFNVSCLLIGLDNTDAVPSKMQFDPAPPQGHPLELFVEWDEGGKPRRVRAEQLIYNRVLKETLSEGPWVYTGSVFQQKVLYMAETEGALIGFMHTVAPIIESPRPISGPWGDTEINPEFNLKPGTQVKLIVRALPKPAR
ncbi:MAG TPA: YdjY domain-containing protein [Vicinamibacterales bacterium]|jgi:hypothetical protein|nr:YdjY domain-containing protein [Vicinamibacterales bacterium]